MAKTLEIRDACPTYDDGLAASRYIDMASEGGIRMALGRRYADIIATAFMEPDHDLSYENTLFAVQDSAVVGMVSGYRTTAHKTTKFDPLRKASGNRLRRSLGLAMLGMVFGVLGSHDDGDYYVAFAGVNEDLRGQGVGTMLLGALEQRARTAHCARFTIEVSARNDRAHRLYERLGWTVESRWPRAKILPPVVYRMAREL